MLHSPLRLDSFASQFEQLQVQNPCQKEVLWQAMPGAMKPLVSLTDESLAEIANSEQPQHRKS